MTLAFGASLLSCVLWGAADFVGGVAARRASALLVVAGAVLFGFVALALPIALADGLPSPTSSGAGMALCAGALDALGLALLFAGLKDGRAALVAPLSGCGALVPVAYALAAGVAPPGPVLSALGLALVGACVVATQPDPQSGDAPDHGTTMRSLALGLGSGACFGVFFLLLGLASQREAASVADIATLSRLGACMLMVPAALFVLAGAGGRARNLAGGWRTAAGVLFVGAADTGANVLFIIASERGDPVMVAVVASLYPAVTVALSAALLRESIGRVQLLGLALLLLGIAIAAPLAPAG